ncbi:hypothetical protein [Pantoea stewartii]|uniref:hypothetical protein n=1 Tax=Pantoea stewartii TaxID=66269 RepID=UPI00249ECE4C|nr:hypothetical protein [Pantoea stewartii]
MHDLKVNILGDFIDSYIYSGVLFTVDVNGVLCSYSWKHLVERYIDSYPKYEKYKINLLDSRDKKGLYLQEDITINIEKKFLEKNQKGTCTGLNVWCTDLDVKDNILYISSEKGVETLPFLNQWHNGAVEEFVKPDLVWSGSKIFGISTGSWGRTILAAGNLGALEIVNTDVEQLRNIGLEKGTLKYRDNLEKKINDDVILDCEWNSVSTLAILDGIDKKLTYGFEDLGSDSIFKDDAKSKLRLSQLRQEDKDKKIKTALSSLKNKEADGVSLGEFSQTWFESNSLHALDSSRNKYIFDNKNKKWKNSSKVSGLEEVSAVRLKHISAGSFLETEEDELFRISDGKKYTMPEDFSSWRVFPRSKSYQDRIHIVYDDFLQIRIFDN